MKSYTDLDQSKKLAEILPLESADMYWKNGVSDKYIQCFTPFIGDGADYDYDIPCWSLTALMSVLRVFTIPTAFSVKVSTPSLIKTENGYKLTYIGDYIPMINNGLDIETSIEIVADNPIDACVNMILKLKEGGLL